MFNLNNTYWAWSGILAAVVIGLIIATLSIITPGYDATKQTVSELASPYQPFASLMQTGFILFGSLLLIFSFGLKRNSQVISAGVYLLFVIAILNIIGGIFSIDLSNIDSKASIIHTLSGALMLLSYLVFTIILFARLKKSGIRKRAANMFTSFGVVGILGLLFMVVMSDFQGIGQRIFYACFFVQLISLAIPYIKGKEEK